MADTGAPHFIPYVEPTDLVRDYPAADEAQAEAVADALDAAGGLVAVKSAIFTGVQATSTAAFGNTAVTDLSITHEVADAANKLIISAFVGVAALSGTNNGQVGLALFRDGSAIAVGDAEGGFRSLTAGGNVSATDNQLVVTMPSISFVHTPGAGSKVYTLRVINLAGTTRTVFVNRNQRNQTNDQRGVSSLVIQEVKV